MRSDGTAPPGISPRHESLFASDAPPRRTDRRSDSPRRSSFQHAAPGVRAVLPTSAVAVGRCAARGDFSQTQTACTGWPGCGCIFSDGRSPAGFRPGRSSSPGSGYPARFGVNLQSQQPGRKQTARQRTLLRAHLPVRPPNFAADGRRQKRRASRGGHPHPAAGLPVGNAEFSGPDDAHFQYLKAEPHPAAAAATRHSQITP